MVCVGKGNEFKAIEERTPGTFPDTAGNKARRRMTGRFFQDQDLESAQDCYLLIVFL